MIFGKKYTLVTDGEKWAVKRKGWLSVKFKSLADGSWWGPDSEGFDYCWGSKEKVELMLRRLEA